MIPKGWEAESKQLRVCKDFRKELVEYDRQSHVMQLRVCWVPGRQDVTGSKLWACEGAQRSIVERRSCLTKFRGARLDDTCGGGM